MKINLHVVWILLSVLLPLRAGALPCQVIISGGGSVRAGGSTQLEAMVAPPSCSQMVTWTSSGGGIGGGMLTVPRDSGTANSGTRTIVVSARQTEPPYASATTNVTVIGPPSGQKTSSETLRPAATASDVEVRKTHSSKTGPPKPDPAKLPKPQTSPRIGSSSATKSPG
jgi:hypothetical protein